MKLPNNKRQFAIDLMVPFVLLLVLGGVVAFDIANQTPMDVVFILDEGAGLAEAAEPIKKNWLKIAKSLTDRGVDCRFAVIPCHPKSEQIPRVRWTADLAELERRLTKATSDLKDPQDAWPVTDSLTALEEVLDLKFRDDASSRVYLVTNKLVEDESRLKKLAGRFHDRNIATIVMANPSDQSHYRPLYKNGGQFMADSNLKRNTRGPVDRSGWGPGPFCRARGSVGGCVV